MIPLPELILFFKRFRDDEDEGTDELDDVEDADDELLFWLVPVDGFGKVLPLLLKLILS